MPATEDNSAKPSRIIIVEDHAMFRDHLRMLIQRDLSMAVAGEADNIDDAMKLLREARPDLAIIDITLRGSSGLEVLKKIEDEGLATKALVLSMHAEELYAERALRAGARGYLSKNEASGKVIEAIRAILRGEVYASTATAARLLDRLNKKTARIEVAGVDTLADRELEAFQLLGRGKSTHEIAAAMRVSESTVETYRARIKEKLQIRSAAQLYLRAGEWVRDHGC